MELVSRHSIIDDVLAEWSAAFGRDRAAYAGHAYRVFNVSRRLLGSTQHDDDLAVASAFHDIGIWTDNTFDYLAPSIRRATDSLEGSGKPATLIADVIANHHRLRRVDAPIVEAFRRADLVDVSRGFIRAGTPRGFHRELVAAFPYAGFHGMLVRTALAWFIRHPLRPLPMMRL